MFSVMFPCYSVLVCLSRVATWHSASTVPPVSPHVSRLRMFLVLVSCLSFDLNQPKHMLQPQPSFQPMSQSKSNKALFCFSSPLPRALSLLLASTPELCLPSASEPCLPGVPALLSAAQPTPARFSPLMAWLTPQQTPAPAPSLAARSTSASFSQSIARLTSATGSQSAGRSSSASGSQSAAQPVPISASLSAVL